MRQKCTMCGKKFQNQLGLRKAKSGPLSECDDCLDLKEDARRLAVSIQIQPYWKESMQRK